MPNHVMGPILKDELTWILTWFDLDETHQILPFLPKKNPYIQTREQDP